MSAGSFTVIRERARDKGQEPPGALHGQDMKAAMVPAREERQARGHALVMDT